MPIAWSELDKIAPDGVDIAMAKKKDFQKKTLGLTFSK